METEEKEKILDFQGVAVFENLEDTVRTFINSLAL